MPVPVWGRAPKASGLRRLQAFPVQHVYCAFLDCRADLQGLDGIRFSRRRPPASVRDQSSNIALCRSLTESGNAPPEFE
jgi:hypothetical protein